MNRASWPLFGVIVLAGIANADTDKPRPVTFGGLLDTYYDYDFDSPSDHMRAFTTQPTHANEPAVNLGYVDAKLDWNNQIRGRFALQAGTSVTANYSAESAPWVKYIQESVLGYHVTDKLWIDGGIYFSHIGFESWISKDDWTYTRSMMADFSPYYQSGGKATYQWTDSLSTQLNILNGWQNVSSDAGSVALGIQVAYAPSERFSATYNNFLNQQPGARWRFFNDFIAKYGITSELQVAATYDIGMQQTPGGDSEAIWQGYAAFLRYQFTPAFALAVRGEQYFDPNQIIVMTNTPNGFQTSGASINADITLHKQVLWRTELRGLWSLDSIYPTENSTSPNDGFVVTSLSLWF